MKKTIIGIILFLLQISLAIYFNKSIDLTVVISIALITFCLVIYNLSNNKYSTPGA